MVDLQQRNVWSFSFIITEEIEVYDMKSALVVGGNSGIGLSIVQRLLIEDYDCIYIVGKSEPYITDIKPELAVAFQEKTKFYRIDLNEMSYDFFDKIQDIDTLIITAGFGRVALFEELTECEINNLIKCNELGAIQIIKKYYSQIKSNKDFFCAVLVSISGCVVSPYFSVYGAAKAGLAMFIENINIELMASGYKNRILNCSPGAISGTAFNGGANDLSKTEGLALDIMRHMRDRETLFVPSYDDIYKGVIDRYRKDPIEFGLSSYEYKLKSNRVSHRPQVVVGYMSGTFDLFHIGHLNIIRRAKEHCDYLIVGVHESGAWKGKETFIPLDERKEIVGSLRYVDKVVTSWPDDSTAWNYLHYDKLFVGSDYKGSERFNQYESYFSDKGVEIIYFPYTSGTSSTELRTALANINHGRG